MKHGFSSDLTKSKRAKTLNSPPPSKTKRRKVEQTTSVRNCIPTTTNRVSEVSLMVLPVRPLSMEGRRKSYYLCYIGPKEL